MTKEDIRAQVELRESDPLSMRPAQSDPSWAIPQAEVKTEPSPVALAFLRACHERTCDCVHCGCGR